jgi:hypothetical protein
MILMQLVPYSLFDFNIFFKLIDADYLCNYLMIDPCSSNADLLKLTATGALIYVFFYVPYSELNKE